jgi:hypothetical protein
MGINKRVCHEYGGRPLEKFREPVMIRGPWVCETVLKGNVECYSRKRRPEQAAVAVAVHTCIRDGLRSATLTEQVRVFAQSLQTKAWTVPRPAHDYSLPNSFKLVTL